MRGIILSLIIISIIIYIGQIVYKDYMRNHVLTTHGLNSHLLENDGKKALKYYNKVNAFDIQEKIGNVYFYGTKNTHKDYDKALLYYKRVFLYDPDNKNIKRIREKINYIMKYKLIQIIKEKQENSKNDIPDNYHEQILNNDIHDYINSLSATNLQIKDTLDIEDIIKNIDNLDKIEIKDIETNDIFKRNDNTHIQNDDQNVHDTGINNTIKTSLNKLKENTFIKYNYQEIYTKILHDLEYNTHFTEIDKYKIRNVLTELTQNQNYTLCDMKLKDCLTLVGNRIYSQTNSDVIDTIIFNLFNELKDCVKDTGEILCLQGIFNRIIHCLNMIDELVTIKPTWCIREELMRKCCKIRQDLEKKMSPNDPKFIYQLKNNIITTLKQEYVHDNKILSLDDFETEINSWIDYI